MIPYQEVLLHNFLGRQRFSAKGKHSQGRADRAHRGGRKLGTQSVLKLGITRTGLVSTLERVKREESMHLEEVQ